MCNSLIHVIQPAFNHVDNNHAFDKEQTQKLKELNEQLSGFFDVVQTFLKERKYENPDILNEQRDEVINLANDILVNRIKILKKNKKGVKISITYIEMLSETRNLLLNVVQLVKAHSRLVQSYTGIRESVTEEIKEGSSTV